MTGLTTKRGVLSEGILRSTLVLLSCALVLALVPTFLSAIDAPLFFRSLIIQTMIFAVFAMSLDVLMGYTGLVSLGHSAFFGLGAYFFGFISINLTPNLLIALPLVLLFTALIAYVLGFFSLRSSGIYFLMLTLAFSQMFYGLAIKWTPVTGGSDGLAGIKRPLVALGNWQLSFGKDASFYFLALTVFIVSWWILGRIVESPFGRTLKGIRENENRMLALGYDTQRYKMTAFIVAGLFGALAGLLFSAYNRHAAVETFSLFYGSQAIIMVLIGGQGTLIGPILGAGIVRLLTTYGSAYTERWQSILGLVFILFVLFAPQGILGLLRGVRKRRVPAPVTTQTQAEGAD